MNTYSKSFLLLFILFFNQLEAKKLDVNFQYFSFQTENGQNYLETYLNFLSSGIYFEKITENEFQGSVSVEMTLRKGDEIVHFDKYYFHTPVQNDTILEQYFLDKQMVPIQNGLYLLELVLIDQQKTSNRVSAITEIVININNKRPSFSDVMLLESYKKSEYENILSKSGFDLIPTNSQGSYFFDENDSLLNFYVEWYNLKEDSLFSNGYLINYFIENDQNHLPIKNFNSVKKKTFDEVRAQIGGFNISTLPSGNYNLSVCLLNRNAKILDIKNIFFQRKNKNYKLSPEDFTKLNSKGSFVDNFLIIEELAEHISCLLPISNTSEWTYASNQLEAWDIELMRQFFYGFWANKNPLEPEAEWLLYLKKVLEANLLYDSPKKKGFATDRGYVMLKYGKANFVETFGNDNQNIPYQIWRFNSINNQSNRDFVFADISMSGNEFKLIHSTVRGEVFNPKWKSLVTRN
jgi:GWxTD domain-containing protein